MRNSVDDLKDKIEAGEKEELEKGKIEAGEKEELEKGRCFSANFLANKTK